MQTVLFLAPPISCVFWNGVCKHNSKIHRSIGDDLFDKFMKNNEINSGIQLINSSFRWRNECGFASCFFFVQTVLNLSKEELCVCAEL